MCQQANLLRLALYKAAQHFEQFDPDDPMAQIELRESRKVAYQNAVHRLFLHRQQCETCHMETWGTPLTKIPLSMPVLVKKGA